MAMLDWLIVAPHDRRLIPEGRLSGPMPWVVAIMIFLTILATAAGLAFAQAGASISSDLASRMMVQVIEANPDARRQQAQAVSARLQQLPDAQAVRILPESEIRDLVAPWIGEDGLGEDIPMPALIDVELRRPVGEAALQRLRQDVQAIAPAAELTRANEFIDPISQLIGTLTWAAIGLVALLAIATAAAVIISARASLNTHRETIDVVHLLGGTDNQITRLFQRRIALDALLGGLLGLLGGVALIWLLGSQFSALETGLAASFSLQWWSWLIIALIPLLGMALAMITARMTVLRSLRKIL